VEALGVDLGQGSLLGRPAPPEVIPGRNGTAAALPRDTSAGGGAPPAPVEQADLPVLAAASAAQDGQEQLAFPYDVS